MADKSFYQEDLRFQKEVLRLQSFFERSRLWLWLILTIIGATPLISYGLYYFISRQELQAQFRERVEAVSGLLAGQIDADVPAEILREGGPGGAAYTALMEHMLMAHRNLPELRYIRLMVIREGMAMVLLDTANERLVDNEGNALATSDFLASASDTWQSPQLSEAMTAGSTWVAARPIAAERVPTFVGCAPIPRDIAAYEPMLCIEIEAAAYQRHADSLARNSIFAVAFTLMLCAFTIYSVLKNQQQLKLSLALLQNQRDVFLQNSRTDPLTGVMNRRAFSIAYAAAEAQFRRGKLPFALISFDIDHFKAVNDNHGHDVGDQVLQNLVDAIVKVLRPSDQLARLGGEEFCIICNVADSAQAQSVAEKLRQTAIRVSVHTNEGKAVHITISLGIHLVDSHEDMETALQNCDKALYLAKQSGRNRAVVYQSAHQRNSATASS